MTGVLQAEDHARMNLNEIRTAPVVGKALNPSPEASNNCQMNS